MTGTLKLVLPVLILTMISAGPAQSQEPSGDAASPNSPQAVGSLSGHTFLPTTYIMDPFIRTFLRTGLGFGMTPELDTPVSTIEGQPVAGLKGSLLYGLMSFEYQHAIRDWLAVRGGLRVVGRLADETRPLLAQGVTLASGFELGWLVRVSESARHSVSASLEIRNASVTDIFLERFIEGVIEDGGLTPGNHLVESTPILNGGGGLHGAYAISDLVGLTATGTLHYGESADRERGETWYYSIGAAVDFNLLSQGGPPIGFVAGLKTGSAPDVPDAGDRTVQTFFGRVGYTGSQAFALGLDMAYDLFPVRNMDTKQGYLSAVVDIRLFFR